MNRQEENSPDFCLDFVQEFGLRAGRIDKGGGDFSNTFPITLVSPHTESCLNCSFDLYSVHCTLTNTC